MGQKIAVLLNLKLNKKLKGINSINKFALTPGEFRGFTK